MPADDRAERLISRHIAAAAAAAAIPIPLVDLLAVTAIQLRLVRSLARLHGARIGFDAADALGVGLFGAVLPRVAASALKLLPGIGTIGGAVAQSALSGATTWALGEALSERLARGAVDSDALAHTAVSRSLERVERLRRRGVLSEEEYQRAREELLEAL